jgi:hypothetical protein
MRFARLRILADRHPGASPHADRASLSP